MKDQYYRELELEPGASPKDIKRAYFKLVRKFTPEKDPEKFRRIREAYEKLQENPEETGPSFQEPAEPFAKKMLAQIFQYHKSGDEILYRDACEEAYRLFPNETVFLYQMVQAQRKAGNTGKAVKSAELLVKKEPENKWFWRELAISYSERGFTRKAYDAFDRAYDLGCRDTDFILMYSMLCNDYGQYETGIRILLEMIDGCQKITGENQQEILEAFVGLVTLNSRGKGNYLAEILDKMAALLRQHPSMLKDFPREIATCLMMVLHLTDSFRAEEKEKLNELVSMFSNAKVPSDVKEMLDYYRVEILLQQIKKDERISHTLQVGAEVFLTPNKDAKLRKYGMTDIQLCMLKEREEILPQLDIIENEYQEYYAGIKEFVQKLRKNENLEYIKSRLLKDYVRMSEECDGGFYFEKYPEEKISSTGRLVYDGSNEVPYVRGNKKIGRNDPCPCGSGKKYKQCCGR